VSDFDIKLALGVVILLNLVFFLAQIGVASLGSDLQFFNYNGSMIKKYDAGNYELVEFNSNELPDSQSAVSTEGSIFTDVWQTVKNWFLDIPGVKYVVAIVNAVPNFLAIIGLPKEIVFAIGFIWHAMTVFLLVVFLKGG
jgi:hypothetical protein